jgi:DNA polymerase-3 subunit delta'
MDGFGSIVGQDRAVGHLRAALATGRPHHAYLFDGPDGIGKHATAIAFAQALACDARPGDGCGKCEPCRKINEGLHPDLIHFEVLPEKGQTERVRDLIPQLAFAPHEARARVVVIDPAHELNDTAANVILKTLEEPPAGTHFVLITATASALLPTIRSRCQIVRFGSLSDGEVARIASANGIEEARAESAAALSGGSVARAMELCSAEELPRRRERAVRLLAVARSGETQAVLDLAGEIAGDREEATAMLDLLWVTYRDAVLIAAGVDEGRVSEARRAEAASLARPATSLIVGMRAVEEARDAVLGYVSPQLALEHLMLRLSQAGAA